RISSSVGPGPRQASLLGFCQETGLRCSECRKAQSGRRRQADLTVHGGVDKAVYAYPSEHYPHWVAKYPKMEIPWGTFGENFTTEGLLENEVHVGDRLGVGSAEFAVTQPRFSLLQARSEIWNPSHPQNFSRLRKVRILSQGSARREGQSWRSDKDDRG